MDSSTRSTASSASAASGSLQSSLSTINVARAWDHLVTLADPVTMKGRDPLSDEGAKMSIAYICQQLETHNVMTLPSLKGSYLDQFQRVVWRHDKRSKVGGFFGIRNRRRETINLHNIVGYKKGRSKDIIVITAHYDHLGFSNNYKTGKSAMHPGADDNASGCGCLLELAIAMQRRDTHYSYAFVFTS